MFFIQIRIIHLPHFFRCAYAAGNAVLIGIFRSAPLKPSQIPDFFFPHIYVWYELHRNQRKKGPVSMPRFCLVLASFCSLILSKQASNAVSNHLVIKTRSAPCSRLSFLCKAPFSRLTAFRFPFFLRSFAWRACQKK